MESLVAVQTEVAKVNLQMCLEPTAIMTFGVQAQRDTGRSRDGTAAKVNVSASK